MRRALVAAALCLASVAHADEDTRTGYRVVVDRVDLEPASVTGFRLRVYVSALALEGHLLDLTDPKSIRLYLNGSEKKDLPYALGTYNASGGDTAIVFVVQATLDYSEALPLIADAIDHTLLADLNDHTQIAFIPFGDSTATRKLQPVKSVKGKVALASDGSAGDPVLVDAVERALMVLKKATTDPPGRPLRKIIVVIGDGRDAGADKDRVTRVATKAGKDGVRIHTIAYSATDLRRPLLVLGELSKRSHGTFRWPGRGHKPTADTWGETFKQLHDEIANQYVITYFVPPDGDVAGKKLKIVTAGRIEIHSDEVKVPEPSCGGQACASGYCADGQCLDYKSGGGRAGSLVKWLAIAGGALVGLVVLLGVIGYFMTKRQDQPGAPKAAKPKKAAPPPPVSQPGLLANGRPIPALLITNGPRAGERHLLRNGFLIGKQPGCDLLIEDGYTSSQHAQIGMDAAGNCKLFDRGSTNGTYVNGVRIGGEMVLQHGLSIRIGSTEMMFLTQ